MGEKKRKGVGKNWIKVLAITGCILFVMLMVVSAMGTGWLSYFSVIKAGDAVTIDFTIRDSQGYPLVTTDQQLYRQITGSGGGIFFSKQLVIQADQSSAKAVVPLPVYSASGGWSDSFALYAIEHDAISHGIIGMKQNEQKSISVPFTESLTSFVSADDLKAYKINMSDVSIGYKIAMERTETPESGKNTTYSAPTIRIGEITRKTANGVTIDFGYPTIDVKIAAISKG